MKKIFIILLVIILGIWGGYYYTKNKGFVAAQSSTIFSPPQDIARFSLVDTKGRPFNNHALWGQWTFLLFGFTGCAKDCPSTLNNLNQLYQALVEQKQNPLPQVVLISIDPAHDTLKKLDNYVQSFNIHFQGATGDQIELDKLAASLNVLATKDKKDNIDHSSAVLLIDPAGKLAAIFSSPHDPKLMAKDFQLIVKNSG